MTYDSHAASEVQHRIITQARQRAAWERNLMKTNYEALKRQVVAIISRSGGPILMSDIAERVSLPQDVALSDLLTELVSEGCLKRGFTLLANGRGAPTFDLVHTS